MIRSAQLRTRALAGGDYKKISGDFNLLLKAADTERDAPALLFAYMARASLQIISR